MAKKATAACVLHVRCANGVIHITQGAVAFFTCIFYFCFSDDEVWKTVILSDNEASLTDVVIPQKKQCRPVTAAKIADIKKQLQFIAAQCRAYYDQVVK